MKKEKCFKCSFKFSTVKSLSQFGVPVATATYIGRYVHTYKGTYTHTKVRTYTQMYLHTYKGTKIHTKVRTYIQMYLHTYKGTYIHTIVPTCIQRKVGRQSLQHKTILEPMSLTNFRVMHLHYAEIKYLDWLFHDYFNQSERFISAQHSYTTLKYANDIGSRLQFRVFVDMC